LFSHPRRGLPSHPLITTLRKADHDFGPDVCNSALEKVIAGNFLIFVSRYLFERPPQASEEAKKRVNLSGI
jgi:hypothetical protein